MADQESKSTPTNCVHLPHYDITFNEDSVMYDTPHYTRDVALCDEESVTYDSGHIVKYYEAKQEPEAIKIGGD